MKEGLHGNHGDLHELWPKVFLDQRVNRPALCGKGRWYGSILAPHYTEHLSETISACSGGNGVRERPWVGYAEHLQRLREWVSELAR